MGHRKPASAVLHVNFSFVKHRRENGQQDSSCLDRCGSSCHESQYDWVNVVNLKVESHLLLTQ